MPDTLKDVLQEQCLLNCLSTNIFSVYQKHILSQLTEVYGELKSTPENCELPQAKARGFLLDMTNVISINKLIGQFLPRRFKIQ